MFKIYIYIYFNNYFTISYNLCNLKKKLFYNNLNYPYSHSLSIYKRLNYIVCFFTTIVLNKLIRGYRALKFNFHGCNPILFKFYTAANEFFGV